MPAPEMESLEIIILCHNRPADARAAIQSILKQTDQAYTLTVSDNSSNDEVELMVKNDFPGVRYVRRIPMLKPLAHFNQCIDGAQADLFCLFHDDDIMHADFVENVRVRMKAYPDSVAFASNALIESYGRIEQRTSFRALRETVVISSPRDLARRYFARAQSGIAPFPAYFYRRKLVGDTRLPVEGGKYADVTWLLSLAMKGNIIWIAAPLITYRMHGSNDGSIESLRDRLRFMGFLKQHLSELGKDLLDDYRCSFIYKKLVKNKNLFPARKRLASLFLRRYSFARYAELNLYTDLLKRAFIKQVRE